MFFLLVFMNLDWNWNTAEIKVTLKWENKCQNIEIKITMCTKEGLSTCYRTMNIYIYLYIYIYKEIGKFTSKLSNVISIQSWVFRYVLVCVCVSEKIKLASTVEKVVSSCDFWRPWDSFVISSFSFRLPASASILRAENKTQNKWSKKN